MKQLDSVGSDFISDPVHAPLDMARFGIDNIIGDSARSLAALESVRMVMGSCVTLPTPIDAARFMYHFAN